MVRIEKPMQSVDKQIQNSATLIERKIFIGDPDRKPLLCFGYWSSVFFSSFFAIYIHSETQLHAITYEAKYDSHPVCVEPADQRSSALFVDLNYK